MDVSDVTPQLDRLEEELNKAQETLEPLLGDIGDISSKLPLLDKAKLYVLVSYTIESLLFSALRLNGVETRNHAIFTELARVKQYVEKIQKLETPPAERETTVNTEAAARIIKANLSGRRRRRKPPRRSGRSSSRKTALLRSARSSLSGRSATGARRRNEKPGESFGSIKQRVGEDIPPTPPGHVSRVARDDGHCVSSARPAPARAPVRNPAQQQQTRPATTYAAPRSAAAAPPAPAAPAASQGPGLMGQMASTAAGVAIGSSIGHMVGGLFSGGSSSEPLPAAQAQQAQATSNNSSWGNNCAGATEQFTKCMDDQGGNMQICGWYLEQLKACQAAASQF
ncbi:Sas10/Utp3/C1D family-domain-containing protein [Chaetomidium leptoderma]|uniref:Exosome complex protein n=1 Tax=Chaetomidium leptoderma TaxID=669021 RepID=A0AAN6VIV0_9PEZI|nr:Sas10/Utp3/C1D family-domain-containing protein [Chaetomidium leptoderma]